MHGALAVAPALAHEFLPPVDLWCCLRACRPVAEASHAQPTVSTIAKGRYRNVTLARCVTFGFYVPIPFLGSGRLLAACPAPRLILPLVMAGRDGSTSPHAQEEQHGQLRTNMALT